MSVGLQSYLFVIRHGESDNDVTQTFSAHHNYSDFAVSHLTDVGRRQIEELAYTFLHDGIDFTTVYRVTTSPLVRAVETCDIFIKMGIAFEKNFVTDWSLTEPRVFGLEGKSIYSHPLYAQRGPDVLYDYSKEVVSLYEGEEKSFIEERVFKVFQRMREGIPRGMHSVCVTHTWPMVLLARFSGMNINIPEPGSFIKIPLSLETRKRKMDCIDTMDKISHLSPFTFCSPRERNCFSAPMPRCFGDANNR